MNVENLLEEWAGLAPLFPLPVLGIFYFWRRPFLTAGWAVICLLWLAYCLKQPWEKISQTLSENDDLLAVPAAFNEITDEMVLVASFTLLCSVYALSNSVSLKNFKKLATSAKLTGAEQSESGTHGTGRLMTEAEAKKDFGAEEGIILAQQKNGNFFRFAELGHFYTECRPRGGKGSSAVCVNGQDWKGPVVCLDPKIENFFVWSRYRWSLGHNVCLLDPLNIAPQIENHFKKHGVHACVQRTSFNVLDFLDPYAENFNAMVQELVANLKDPKAEKATSDPFWIEAPANFLAMIVQYVCCAPEEELIGPRNLITVRDYCFHDNFTDLIDQWAKRSELANGAVARRAISLKEFKNNIRGYASISEIARNWLTFLDDKGTAHSLCGLIGKPFSSSDILRGKTDIFIGVPLEMLETQPQFARVVITALLHEVMRAHGIVDERILFILDEMPRLGYLPVIDAAAAALSGMGASIWGIVQSYSQLEAKWGREQAKSFWECCCVYQYFGITPPNAKRVEELIGDATVIDRSVSHGAGDSHQMDRIAGTFSRNKSESVRHVKRALITADELKTLGDDEIIIQVVGKPPLRTRRVKYFEHPDFKGHYDPNPYMFTGKL